MTKAQQLVERLRRMGSKENLAGMVRFGITTGRAFGVPVVPLRALAREAGRDHAVALDLWTSGIREARLLAAFTADPAAMTKAQMNAWVRDIDSWDICDGCCNELFRKTPYAWEQALRWSAQRAEYTRRAGFVLMAVLAVHDKSASDRQFLALLPIIERESGDARNFVKKAVNWALRQIGKRNPRLRAAAIKTAARLAKSELASARWIGSDALRERSSDGVVRRTRRLKF
jgi:3-methyladenine DNA glycosylase AlkD